MDNQIITVSPMVQQAFLTPGQVYEGSFTIINPAYATSVLNYEIEISPYSVVNEKYRADLSIVSQYTTITDWISLDESNGAIEPNGSHMIHYTITVPEDATASGQYAAFIVSAVQPEIDTEEGAEPPQSPTIQESTGIASILYAIVDGEITHNSSILENYIPKVFAAAPYNISATLKNEGNIHEKATFSITATDVFSGQILYENHNYTEFILPDTTRYTEREIDNLPMIGLVKIAQSIHLSGDDSFSEQIVLICPVWLMLIIFVAFFSIVASIVFAIRRRRGVNKIKCRDVGF